MLGCDDVGLEALFYAGDEEGLCPNVTLNRDLRRRAPRTPGMGHQQRELQGPEARRLPRCITGISRSSEDRVRKRECVRRGDQGDTGGRTKEDLLGHSRHVRT